MVADLCTHIRPIEAVIGQLREAFRFANEKGTIPVPSPFDLAAWTLDYWFSWSFNILPGNQKDS